MKTSRPFVLIATCAFALVVTASPVRDASAGEDDAGADPRPCWERRFPPPLARQDTPPVPPPETPPVPPQETPVAPPVETPPDTPPAQSDDGATPDGGAKPAEPAPAEPPPAPVVDAPTDEEDAAARALLEPAAKRQGGDSLAAPTGTLESFHVTFSKVTIHRLKENEDGSVTRQKYDSEDEGLKVDWKLGQIRTEWRLSGETPVIRGVLRKPNGEDYPWLWDGEARRDLRNAGYERDLAEIERDRRIVKAMLQASVLRSLLNDGSRWKILGAEAAGKGFDGVAIRRLPPPDVETPLRLTLWVDPKTDDVSGARLEPNVEGESTMFYGFVYHPLVPVVKDKVIRFPARFRVMEQRAGEKEPVDVMDATAKDVSFNDVSDDVFKPPRK